MHMRLGRVGGEGDLPSANPAFTMSPRLRHVVPLLLGVLVLCCCASAAAHVRPTTNRVEAVRAFVDAQATVTSPLEAYHTAECMHAVASLLDERARCDVACSWLQWLLHALHRTHGAAWPSLAHARRAWRVLDVAHTMHAHATKCAQAPCAVDASSVLHRSRLITRMAQWTASAWRRSGCMASDGPTAFRLRAHGPDSLMAAREAVLLSRLMAQHAHDDDDDDGDDDDEPSAMPGAAAIAAAAAAWVRSHYVEDHGFVDPGGALPLEAMLFAVEVLRVSSHSIHINSNNNSNTNDDDSLLSTNATRDVLRRLVLRHEDAATHGFCAHVDCNAEVVTVRFINGPNARAANTSRDHSIGTTNTTNHTAAARAWSTDPGAAVRRITLPGHANVVSTHAAVAVLRAIGASAAALRHGQGARMVWLGSLQDLGSGAFAPRLLALGGRAGTGTAASTWPVLHTLRLLQGVQPLADSVGAFQAQPFSSSTTITASATSTTTTTTTTTTTSIPHGPLVAEPRRYWIPDSTVHTVATVATAIAGSCTICALVYLLFWRDDDEDADDVDGDSRANDVRAQAGADTTAEADVSSADDAASEPSGADPFPRAPHPPTPTVPRLVTLVANGVICDEDGYLLAHELWPGTEPCPRSGPPRLGRHWVKRDAVTVPGQVFIECTYEWKD